MSMLTEKIVEGVYNGLVTQRETQQAALENAGSKTPRQATNSTASSSPDLGTRGDVGGSSFSDQLRSNSASYNSMMGASMMGSGKFTKAEVNRGYRKIKA